MSTNFRMGKVNDLDFINKFGIELLVRANTLIQISFFSLSKFLIYGGLH